MLRLAILTARGRLGTFAGALVALIASSALVMGGAMPFESALRTEPPVERYAGATAVVTGQQVIGSEDKVPLTERARVDSSLTGRLAAVPARWPRGGRPRMGQRRTDALQADRRARAHGIRRGRHRLPRQGGLAS